MFLISLSPFQFSYHIVIFYVLCSFSNTGNLIQSKEPAALAALRHFNKVDNGYHLVPEHIESRTLYLPDKPGISQVGSKFLSTEYKILLSFHRMCFLIIFACLLVLCIVIPVTNFIGIG